MNQQKKPAVVARILGGIGNQLFIYAAARRLAIKNGADLVLDNVSGFVYDHVYERHYQLNHFNIAGREASWIERLEPISKLRRFFKRYINNYRPYEHRNYIFQNINEFDARLLEVKLAGRVHLEGYWQSERFFSDIEDVIRKELRIKPPIDSSNLAMADNIRKTNSVAIHVRFFGDPDSSAGVTTEFYNRAIRLMESKVPDAHYFVFSDKPEEAVKKIELPSTRMTLVNHNVGDANAYADLWLMTLCTHFIIANSTFSWWGAWLSDSVEKIVIAPSYIHHESNSSKTFDRMVLEDWIKC